MKRKAEEEPSLEGFSYKHDFSIDLGSERWAKICLGTLDVDAELRPERCRRNLKVEDARFIAHFEATQPKFLRVSVNSFMTALELVLKTIKEFDPELEAEVSTN